MGRGAEASALVVMSICSGVDSSMAWSWGDWRTPGPPLGTRGLRCQQCPPENLTGLKAQRRNRWMMKNGRLIIFCILTAEKGQNSDSDKNFKWFYQLNWRNIVMENKKKIIDRNTMYTVIYRDRCFFTVWGRISGVWSRADEMENITKFAQTSCPSLV